MHKILRPFTQKTWRGGRYMSVFIEVEIKDGRLSITGVQGPTRGRDALGSCGQIDMEYAHRNPAQNDARYTDLITTDELRFAPGWDADMWLDLLDVWKRFHLNDLHAGCEHQRALGWEAEGYNAHPSEPCPTCGYKFGSAWQAEPLPAWVIQFLEWLPETDRQPAWV